MVETLFEDIFTVTQKDPDGKKFDRVNRIEARSEQFDMFMLLDINTEIYPMRVKDKFMMVLASTLNLDGTPDTGYFIQKDSKIEEPEMKEKEQKKGILDRIVDDGGKSNKWVCQDFHNQKGENARLIEHLPYATFTSKRPVKCITLKGNKKSLADKFEYVMHGKLYRISEEGSGKHVKADIFVSFGGLLMQLRGDPSIAAKFELDQKIFLLIRKV